MAKPPDKKKSSRAVLLICAIAIAFFAIRQSGCEITKRVERTEWID